MGRIKVLSDQVANQIAAGEVVDRPASVVKELLENALDAGANRIRVEVEAGGRKLMRISDDGCGMNRDDAFLAFERHATSKLRTADDLLSIATLGFRGEALPSIASVARVTLETAEHNAEGAAQAGTRIEIAGGKILHVDEIAAPAGTTIAVSDLFFNTPARRKFLRAESTELAHITALVTHYALVHPEKHFELVSSTHTLVLAPPVKKASERVFQIFGQETLGQLIPVAAEMQLARSGLPEPAPWKRDPEEAPRQAGQLRLSGYLSKPELQKLNRNSIYIFVNKRLIRDRSLLHAITEAYRNVIPPNSFPVALLYLEMPPEEVDVNVHPAKTEVRFRQQSAVHDFVRDSLRTALVKARPAADFLSALQSAPTASPSLLPQMASPLPGVPESEPIGADGGERFEPGAPIEGEAKRLPFSESQRPDWQAGKAAWNPSGLSSIPELLLRSSALFSAPKQDSDGLGLAGVETSGEAGGEAGIVGPGAGLPGVSGLARLSEQHEPADGCSSEGFAAGPFGSEAAAKEVVTGGLNQLASLRPVGQLRESFILAIGEDGLWIIDQHVAHERVLFEQILRNRKVERTEKQRLLLPMLVELKPWQMVLFAEIADELEKNGFEVEPFGPQTLAVKAAPVGLEGKALERMLVQVIEQAGESNARWEQKNDLSTLERRIAASIACHAAVKVNFPLDLQRMEWLLAELAKTEHPTNCPHGRPIALHYSWRDIQRAFQRI